MIFGSLGRLIAIDVRNLAVLRVGLAMIILIDLAQRVGSIEVFCSDQGVLNRELNQWLCPPSDGFWSLYWLNGSSGFAAGLMVVNAVAAFCLLLGWQTRLATAACLVLAFSLQMRNPFILTAGHILLRMLLFWSLFLPIGAVWSIDDWRKRGKSGSVGRPATARGGHSQVVSIAAAAIIVQVAAMYFFSGLAKWNDIWLRGEAMSLAMQLDMYVKPLGRELLAYPALLMLLTFSILVLETVGPLLLWMPIATAQWRVGLMVLFWLMHIGIWLTMSIGIFSAVAMLAWVVFVPHEFWNVFRPRHKKTQPHVIPTSLSANTIYVPRMRLASSIVCAMFLLYIVALNVANIDPAKSETWFGPPLRKFGNATMTLQQFKMFERPAEENLWWQMMVRGPIDGYVDILGPTRTFDLERRPNPEEIYDSIPSQFWRRWLYNLATFKFAEEDRHRIGELKGRTTEAWWILCRDRVSWPVGFPRPQLLVFRQKIESEETMSPIRYAGWGMVSPSLINPR